MTPSAEQPDALSSALDKLPSYRELCLRGYAGRQGPGFPRPPSSSLIGGTFAGPLK